MALVRGWAEGGSECEWSGGGEEEWLGRDGGGGGGENRSTDTPLTLALRDPHLQEILLKETTNARAAAREKAKLAQMEVDGRTPLYPGCRPDDTRLSVTLKALEMKADHKWTDTSFNALMQFWHSRLSKDNTLPTSIEEARKVVCPLDLPYVKYHACINDCALYQNEYKDRNTCRCAARDGTREGTRKFLEKWCVTFLSLPVCSGIS